MQLELWKKFSRLQFRSISICFVTIVYKFICAAAGPGRPFAREFCVKRSHFCVSARRAHPWANYNKYFIESASLLKFTIFRDRASFQGPLLMLFISRDSAASTLCRSRRGLKAKCTPYTAKSLPLIYISVIFVWFQHVDLKH